MRQIPTLNVMALRVQRHANVIKKQRYWMDLTLARLNGTYVGVA